MPILHLLAGPNGSGKTSYARDVLTPVTGLPFINADNLAAAHWPHDPSEHSYEAARMAETERRRLMTQGTSFITETVFSHPSKVALLADASTLGYLVQLHVFIVPVELSVLRVADRVRRGGHPVPETKIRTRYDRLWNYIAQAIKIVDTAEVYDNTSASEPFRHCATYANGTQVGPVNWPRWAPEPLATL